MTVASVKVLASLACLSALTLMVGLTGCASDRYLQSPGHRFDDHLTAESGNLQSTDRTIEDRRTAERVREALAAGADYKFDGVTVTVRHGVVQLSGFVNTSAQRTSAGALTSKVPDVQNVENNLAVKD